MSMKEDDTQNIKSNVVFAEDKQEQQQQDAGSKYTLEKQDHNEDIGHFLNRPVHLYDLEWGDSAMATRLQPWYAWYTNKRINNRIANYRGFRGNLKLKFVVIGNPYYFGRMQFSYRPLEGYGGSDVYSDDDFTDDFGGAMIRSQRQVLNLDPSVSSGIEMEFPYVWPFEFSDVPSMITETLLMGSVRMDELVQLRSLADETGATPPKVTIRVYGEMNNIELIGTTAFTSAVIPQSDKEGAEQAMANTGLVSSKLTTIGDFAAMLSDVPGFAPYATATSMAAKAGAKLAQALGYSRPNNYTEAVRYQPRPLDMLTHIVGADLSVKLTLDPEQQVTIDPVVCGATSDEMSFKSIISKKSLFCQPEWSVTNSPGDLLYQVPVTPNVSHSVLDGGETEPHKYMTSMGAIAVLFNYWCGTINYKFDIISNAFHRGRLLVVYDPKGSKGTNQEEEVVQYAAVIDISEARSFSVSIAMNSNFGMLPVGDLALDNDGSTSGKTADTWENGCLSIYVANDLTIPSIKPGTPTNVTILGYVSGGDDMYFTSPRRMNFNSSDTLYFPNSDDQLLKASDINPDHVLDVTTRDTSSVPTIYGGERVDSLRALNKRYCHYYTQAALSTAENALLRFIHGAYPAFPGPTKTDLSMNIDGSENNTVGFTYPAYSQMGYVTQRGSMRWRFIPISSAVSGAVMVGRLIGQGGSKPMLFQDSSVISDPSIPATTASRFSHFMAGGHLTTSHVNSVLDFEMPFQNFIKFYLGQSGDNATGNISGNNEAFAITGYGGSFGSRFSLFAAAGEDYSLQHFIGFPPCKIGSY